MRDFWFGAFRISVSGIRKWSCKTKAASALGSRDVQRKCGLGPSVWLRSEWRGDSQVSTRGLKYVFSASQIWADDERNEQIVRTSNCLVAFFETDPLIGWNENSWLAPGREPRLAHISKDQNDDATRRPFFRRAPIFSLSSPLHLFLHLTRNYE